MNPISVQCPHCGFSRQVPADKIPPGRSTVTCPKCEKPFRFSRQESDFGFSIVEPAQPAPKALEKPAGFWIRALALLIDVLLVSLGQQIFAVFLETGVNLFSSAMTDQMLRALDAGIQLGGFCLSLLYTIGLTGTYGQTLGKMALKIRVVRVDGRPIGYGYAAVRETLGKLVSFLLLGVGFLMAAFDSKKQGMHDKMADTRVVRL